MRDIRKNNVHQKTTNRAPAKRGEKTASNKELTERQHEDSRYQDLRYRELVNNMSSAVAVYQAVRSGEDFIFKDFNRAGERIEKVKREDIIGKSVREIFPSVQEFGLFEVFQRVWRTGRPEHFPIAQYKDERIAGWRDNYVYKLPTGEIVAAYNDVTEHRKAVEALRESEEKYRNVVERANDGICIIQDNIVKYVNARLGEIWGGPAEEIVNKPFTDYIHPDKLPQIIDRYNRRLAGEQVPAVYETVLRIKDGSSIDTELNVGMITYQGKPAELVLIRDITERKQIEEELIAERDKLQIVTSNIGVGLAVISRDYRTLWANNVLTELFGEAAGKICYSTYNRQPSICPWCGVQTVFEKGEDRVETEAYGFDKNGKTIWSQIIATPIRDKEGKVISALEVVVPITERKQAEETIERQREEYRTIFDSVPTIIAYSDRKGRFIRINKAGADALGSTPKEVVGKTFHDYFAPEVANNFIRHGNEVIESGVPIIGSISQYQLPTGMNVVTSADVIPYKDRSGKVIGFIDVVEDITEREKSEDERKKSYEKLRGTLEAAVEAIATIAETRDPYTAGHQKSVAKLACAIAGEMRLSEEKIADIRTGATLHDIGKMYIPAEILSKPVKLNQLEFSMIKTHPQVGYDIVKKIEFPCAIANMALQHHERLDGSGYPQGLSGDNILLEAKILAVADVIEAMASHRPYRPALGIDKALEEISKNKGKLYDPDVVDACVRLFNEKGFKFE